MITSSSLRQPVQGTGARAQHPPTRRIAHPMTEDLTDRTIDRSVPVLPALHRSEDAP
jgi:hypothetical protein